jgi:tRNA splicing endonuclease
LLKRENRGPPQADADAAPEEVSLDELEATLDMARTPAGQAQRTVFNDLWQRGHYITSGALYGAHLVAYADDPLVCHSFAGVRALLLFLHEELVANPIIQRKL